MLNAKLDQGREVVRSAWVVPSECPEIGGYFVAIKDNLGNEGLLVAAGTMNVSQEQAQVVADEAIGKRVEVFE